MANTIPGIMVYKKPKKVLFGQWVISHPDCDSICERVDTTPEVYIHAYAKSKRYNSVLKQYRDRYLPAKSILRGISADGINGIV